MPGYATFQTSLGRCALAFGDDGIVATVLPSQTEPATIRALLRLVRARALFEADPALDDDPPAWVASASRQIVALLAGEEVDLDAIKLDTRNMSDFRARIYEAARKIPRGERVTYGELAKAAGSPNAARAVGRAMATNPWPLLVPCHRVVAKEGALHGFSAPGGIRTKAALLAIEDHGTKKAPAKAPPRRKPRRSKQASLPLFR